MVNDKHRISQRHKANLRNTTRIWSSPGLQMVRIKNGATSLNILHSISRQLFVMLIHFRWSNILLFFFKVVATSCHWVRFFSAKYTVQDQTRLLWMVMCAFAELQAICQLNTLLRQAIVRYTELMCCAHYHTAHYDTHRYTIVFWFHACLLVCVSACACRSKAIACRLADDTKAPPVSGTTQCTCVKIMVWDDDEQKRVDYRKI